MNLDFQFFHNKTRIPVPLDDIVDIDDEGDISINFVHTIKPTTDANGTKTSDNDGDLDTDKAADNSSSDSNSDPPSSESSASVASDDQVNSLFGKDFIKVYQNFHDKIQAATALSSSELEIKLHMVPVQYELVKIGCLPFLSRAVVEENPGFRQEYFDMHKIARTHGFNAFLEHWMDFANRMTEERGLFMETTVTADIVVDCRESFQVKEYPDGDRTVDRLLLQGDSETRLVRHLVRMELDFAAEFVDGSQDDLRWFKGNWRIVDVDDLMDTRGEWLIPMPTKS